MRKIKYDLIVSDFDGTLVCEDGTISNENKKAIAEYTEAGGIFAVSTGRLHYGILPRVKELGLKGVVCCCQGAVILDIESGEFLLRGTISNATTVKICQKMESLGVHFHVYDGEAYYCNKDDEWLRWYETAVRHKATLVTDKPVSQFVKENGVCAFKILAIVDPSENARIMSEVKKENFEGCIVTKSADVLVEVVNANYSKGTAVEFLSRRFGVPTDKIIGVGDQWNDMPMIEKAGLGVAVKNADEKLKNSADIVLEYTNEESAIARMIEKYAYTED